MDITYNNYPTILYTSFDNKSAPPELPFRVISDNVSNYLSRCTGFSDLFSYISTKNTIENINTNTYYYLDNNVFNKIDSDNQFRNQYFTNIFKEYIKPRFGAILLPGGGQYVYAFLDTHETKRVKGRSGRYIASALFQNDFFIGFEEGYLTQEGITVEQGGHYDGGMDKGGFISFVMITLSYTNNQNLDTVDTAVKEQIFKIR